MRSHAHHTIWNGLKRQTRTNAAGDFLKGGTREKGEHRMAYYGMELRRRARRSTSWHSVEWHCAAVHIIPCGKGRNRQTETKPATKVDVLPSFKNRLPWQRWSGFDVFGPSKWYDIHGYAMALHAMPRCAPPCSPTPFYATICHAVLTLSRVPPFKESTFVAALV